MSFTNDQIAELNAPLDKAKVATRKKQGDSGPVLSYIEGWHAIAEANRIFGFDSWTRETVDLRCVAERTRTIGKKPYEREGWGVSYVAKVRVVVFAGDTLVTREGIGSGHGIDVDCGQAHESAVKEAETDAMKRALSTFGWPFGLALYDKTREHVAEHGGNGVDKTVNPDTGRPVNPRSSAQAKKRGDWDEFLADLRDARSPVRVEAIKSEWLSKDNLPSGWRASVTEECEKRISDLTAADPADAFRQSIDFEEVRAGLVKQATEHAKDGKAALANFWKTLSDEETLMLDKPEVARLQSMATEADERRSRASARAEA